MSTTNENVTKNENKNEQVKFEINVKEHPEFEYICKRSLMTSVELCSLISDLFKEVYADFEGTTFEMIPNTNNFMVCLHFNHKNTDGSPLATACTKEIDDGKTKNETLRRIRIYDARIKEGEKYYLTEEGKQGIAKFLQDNRALYKDKNNSPRWDKIVGEVADPASVNMYGAVSMQYTKVSYIDPTKVIEEIYGSTDKDGNRLCYNISIIGSVPTMNNNKIFRLGIDVISEKNLVEYANRNGLGNMYSNLNIIR